LIKAMAIDIDGTMTYRDFKHVKGPEPLGLPLDRRKGSK